MQKKAGAGISSGIHNPKVGSSSLPPATFSFQQLKPYGRPATWLAFPHFLRTSRSFPLRRKRRRALRIRAVDTHTPVVIFSGHGFESHREAGMLAGANAYVVKPDVTELIPTVKRLLEESPTVTP